MSLRVKVETALALGLFNLVRVWFYRCGIRYGLNPVTKLSVASSSGPYFREPQQALVTATEIDEKCFSRPRAFGWKPVSLAEVPNWFNSPLDGKEFYDCCSPWWELSDFGHASGDIKAIWEASRFDWVLSFAQRAGMGDGECCTRLNTWLADWLERNPPYLGPNWKCGQEASIRVMHLAMAAVILDQAKKPEPALLELIRLHLMRIAPTLSYAIAQDNNHGTSEAAALFIGGSWLADNGYNEGRKWQQKGRKWLENRALRLIEEDGSFSQYSVNYHRVMLDTFSMAEVWRRALDLARFSVKVYKRLASATLWLYQFVQPESGDVPNLGANDGARLLPLTNTDYRDYRPAVQLAMALFNNVRAYGDKGAWDLPLQWLRVKLPEQGSDPVGSVQFDCGGYSLLRNESSFAMLTYPRFRFRPSQADALHLDFWWHGENVLRDAGTYSYSVDETLNEYFAGTNSHNTVQFDDRDQMPRLGRFLFGKWLSAEKVTAIARNDGELSCSAGYTDWMGAGHHRSVVLGEKSLKITDRVRGFKSKAVVRWRLTPGDWHLDGTTVTNGKQRVAVTSDVPIQRCELVGGFESRYYLKKSSVPVLEVEIQRDGEVVTELANFQ